MCGLVGVFGDSGRTMTNMFELMLQVDVIRGDDSTGVGAIRRDGIKIIKEEGPPFFVLLEKEYHNTLREWQECVKNFCLMGHNRAATRGKVSKENAHPFRHGHITLTHNGSLHHTHSITLPNQPKTFDTDSEQITYAIAQKGIDWVYPRLYGAAALVFWDNREKTLNLVTDGSRPLSVGYDENNKWMLWASKGWMIMAALTENREKLNKGLWYPLEKDVLYTFKMEGKKISYTNKKLASYVPVQHHHPHNNNVTNVKDYINKYKRHWPGTYEQRKAAREAGKKEEHKPTPPNRSVIPFSPTGKSKIVTPPAENSVFDDDDKKLTFTREKKMSEAAFYSVYKSCMFCEGSLKGEYQEAVVFDDEHAVCNSCAVVGELEGMNIFSMKGI